MDKQIRYKDVKSYLFSLQQKSIYTFTTEDIFSYINKSDIAIRREMDRLTAEGKITNIRKGFYLIITPEYYSSGIMPASFFMDQMMLYLKRSYYFGLLSAAAMHGATHQQPQANFLIIQKPTMHPILNDKISIYFSTKSIWPKESILRKNTLSGSIALSSPALTMFDLIQYPSLSGGFDQVTLIIQDLLESITKEDLNSVLRNKIKYSVLQRCGYLLDRIYMESKLSEHIYNHLKSFNLHFVSLDVSSTESIRATDKKWCININTDVEIEY